MVFGRVGLYEICESAYPGKLLEYVERAAAKFTDRFELISFTKLQKEIFGVSNPLSYTQGNQLRKLISPVVEEEDSKQKKILAGVSGIRFVETGDIWRIFKLKGDFLSFRTYDFGSYENKAFRQCSMRYAKHQIKVGIVQQDKLNLFSKLKLACNFFHGMGIKTLNDVDIVAVRKLIHYLEFECCAKWSGKKLVPKSIHRTVRDCFGLWEYFIRRPHELPTGHLPLQTNPFNIFHFRCIDQHVEKTLFIPEEVIEQIYLHLDELPKDVARVFNIMMGTGLRVSEALSLKTDQLSFDKDQNIHVLSFIPYKTLKARRRLGLDDCHKICIGDQSVIDDFNDQAASVKALGEEIDSKNIFLRKHSSRRSNVMILSESAISRKVNDVITKHNICSHVHQKPCFVRKPNGKRDLYYTDIVSSDIYRC